jgi:hypothetical protein
MIPVVIGPVMLVRWLQGKVTLRRHKGQRLQCSLSKFPATISRQAPIALFSASPDFFAGR